MGEGFPRILSSTELIEREISWEIEMQIVLWSLAVIGGLAVLAAIFWLFVLGGMAKCFNSPAQQMKDEAEQDCSTAPCRPE